MSGTDTSSEAAVVKSKHENKNLPLCSSPSSKEDKKMNKINKLKAYCIRGR